MALEFMSEVTADAMKDNEKTIKWTEKDFLPEVMEDLITESI